MIKEGLQDLMSAMFGAWAPIDGCADDEITAAEDRLGISLPDALRDYCTVAGRHPELMGMDGREHTLRLSAPRDLSLADGQLVFCGENQGPAAWSVRPADAGWPDPRVHGRAEPGGKWYSEARRLSAFLINVAGRQAVWAAPYQAACRLREDQLVAVEPLLGFIGSREMQKGGHWLSFVDRSSRVVAHYSYITSTLRIGAVVPGALESLRECSGLPLGPA
ncbi:SMI1/KNR4 family protein [Streptomyces sp. NPDC005820]|uniref:SMI1/KNR4 family protein n=1 Tax=Streptomyces sp. NPDC005820 TaxID=3157069 RepID=UPI0033C64C43